MNIPVSIETGTPFDVDYGDEGIITISFTTEEEITYKSATTLYFYAVITEDATSQTVCFKLSGDDNPLPAGTVSFTIGNTSSFTGSATATGEVYYTAA